MRWAVELPAASGGTGPTVTIDAESWKSALTEARGGRALTKFRVDFDEDGTVRVHDLVTNERFKLRPSSASIGASASSTAGAPTAPSTPPVTVPSAHASIAPDSRALQVVTQPDVQPPSHPHGEPQESLRLHVVTQPDVQPPSHPLPSLQTAPAAPAPPAPLELVVPTPGTLFFSRDRQAAASNGLTYRERLIAVPPGTSVEQCIAIAREVLRQLRESLTSMPPGKFVSIAVFDHIFKSRPERPPIIVLGWKDWRGDEPDITVSRPSATSTPPTTSNALNSLAPSAPSPPSIAPVAQPVAQPLPTPPAEPVPTLAPAPPASPRLEPVAALVRPDASMVADRSTASAVAATATPKQTVAFNELPSDRSASITAAHPYPAPPSAQPALSSDSATASVDEGTETPGHAPLPLSKPVQPVPLLQHHPAMALGITPSQPPPATPSVPSTAAQPTRAEVAPYSAAHSVSSAVASSAPNAVRTKKPIRRRGDELLGEAFEALSDMAFLTSPSQAVDFAAQVAKDLLHTPFVVISLYDIDKHELAIECCDAAPSAKGRRLKVHKGETRSDVMLRGLPARLSQWEPDAFVTEAPIGPALFVSIALDRRLFGVIELHREVGDHDFEQDEQEVTSYIARQLAQFLADYSKRVGFRDETEPSRRK